MMLSEPPPHVAKSIKRIASPVDFISGPNKISTPLNLLKGKTASFTANLFFEYQGSNLFLNLCRSVSKNKRFNINGKTYDSKDGTTIRDFIHVSDSDSAPIMLRIGVVSI